MIFNSFPQFREFADEKTYDCRENCFMRLYRGVTADSFHAYETRLVAAGFKKIASNENNGNLFSAFEGEGKQITAFFSPCDSSLRVTASENLLHPQYEKCECANECPTTFWVFENDHTLIDCGMCLLIQCSDYSFFVVDSGHYYQLNDNDRIYRFMRERTPEGRKVTVAGWFITHGHSDHISKFSDFLKYNLHDVEIEAIYSNLISNKYACETWGTECVRLPEKLFLQLDECNIPKIKLHSGQHFYIRNLQFDVLCTQEDVYPQPVTDYNDSSSVLMMSAQGSRVCITGDAAVLESKILEERYGESLRCDVMQMAHHGHTGLSKCFYELAAAQAVIFPITRIKFDEEYPRIEANRRAIEIAKEHYISSDGTIEIRLPYVFGNTKQLPDESFEDFVKIKAFWGYDYTQERKEELLQIFREHGGDIERLLLPAADFGSWID